MTPLKPFSGRLNASLIQTLTICVFGISSIFGQDEIDAELITAESLEAKAQRLFETRKAIAKERAAWAEQKPLFESLIALREKEIAGIDEFTAAATERIEDVTAKRDALQSEEADRKAWRASFASEVAELETLVKAVIPLLPPPVREKVGDSISRLEAQSIEELPLQERFRDLLTILSASRDFDSKLTIDSEVREIEGKRYQIDVLYLGLDHAWFVDESGKIAGVGIPSNAGWIWNEDRSIASTVQSTIAIHRREAPPAMVSLPFAPKPAPSSPAE